MSPGTVVTSPEGIDREHDFSAGPIGSRTQPADTLLCEIRLAATQPQPGEKETPFIGGLQTYRTDSGVNRCLKVALELVTATDVNLDLCLFFDGSFPPKGLLIPLDGLLPTISAKGTTTTEKGCLTARN